MMMGLQPSHADAPKSTSTLGYIRMGLTMVSMQPNVVVEIRAMLYEAIS